jgi:hypothetical protein
VARQNAMASHRPVHVGRRYLTGNSLRDSGPAVAQTVASPAEDSKVQSTPPGGAALPAAITRFLLLVVLVLAAVLIWNFTMNFQVRP